MIKERAILILFFAIFISNAFVALCFQLCGIHMFLLSLKDIFLLLIIFILLPKIKFYQLKLLWPFLPFALFILVQFFLSPFPFMAKIASARQLLNPFVALATGIFLVTSISEKKMQLALPQIAYLLLIGSVFVYAGLQFEMFDLKNYAYSKHLEVSDYHIPFMFYDSLSGNLIRNTSFLLDPINLGHSLVFIFTYLLYKKNASKILLALLLISLLLCVSKGAFLHLIIALLFIEKNRFPKWLFYTGLIAMIPFLFLAAQYHPGIAYHLDGMKKAIEHISFFGIGLASVGNQASIFNAITSYEIHDTYIGELIGQLGIVGLLLWLFPFVKIMIAIKKEIVLTSLLIAQLMIALISDNTFNLLSVLLLLVYCGYAYAQFYEEKNSHN